MGSPFAGQWIGESTAGNPARAVLDLDDEPDFASGTARIFFRDGSPGAICHIRVPPGLNYYNVSGVGLAWIPPNRAAIFTRQQMEEMDSDIRLPDTVDLKLAIESETLTIEWTTPIGTAGSLSMYLSTASKSSDLEAEKMTWDQFKNFALSQSPGTMIFRGQPQPYKLRTAFHRTYRKDLVRYSFKDISAAHRQLSGLTKYAFDLSKPNDRGAFWHLLQHHGYPTPMLDWTMSPFVAAFFAYRRRQAGDRDDLSVRIFAFDRVSWESSFPQISEINFVEPHFSILEALPIENPRALPQQSLSTLTNVDDVEAYVAMCEKLTSKSFLKGIDLPASLRPHVMSELSLMGITAGSLFPGLDGACEELMGRMFHHQVAPIVAK